MLERGFAVRLLTDTGSSVPGPDGSAGFTGDSSDMAGVLLDTLAVVDHSDGETLSAAYDVLRSGREGLLVAFFGDLYEEQAAGISRMRQRAGGAVAFVLDSDDWLVREAAGRPELASAPVPPAARGARDGQHRARGTDAARGGLDRGRGAPGGRAAGSVAAGGPLPVARGIAAGRARSGGGVMSGRARLTVCAVAASMLAACALLPLATPNGWIIRALLCVCLQAGVGAAGRMGAAGQAADGAGAGDRLADRADHDVHRAPGTGRHPAGPERAAAARPASCRTASTTSAASRSRRR